MSRNDPAWAEHQRRGLRPDWQRWVRHDAHLFEPPDLNAYRSYAARLVERVRAEERKANVAAEQAVFRESVLQLRRELAEVKFDLAWRRILRKYDPNQPRAPKGSPDGGKWTKDGRGDAGEDDSDEGRVVSDETPDNDAKPGAQYASRRVRGPLIVRIGGRTFRLEGGHAIRFEQAQINADTAIARVRELDRNWKAVPSLAETVEGQIAAFRGEARQAEARLAELAREGIGPGPHAGESIPARGLSRYFTQAEREEINRIGALTGCHTCGTQSPGTRSGNFVCDHQTPIALNSYGRLMRIYPQCLSCSLRQGGNVSNLLRDR